MGGIGWSGRTQGENNSSTGPEQGKGSGFRNLSRLAMQMAMASQNSTSRSRVIS